MVSKGRRGSCGGIKKKGTRRLRGKKDMRRETEIKRRRVLSTPLREKGKGVLSDVILQRGVRESCIDTGGAVWY